MHLVRGALAGVDARLPRVAISVDRQRLARRLWRARAADGAEFGFDLAEPLAHGDVVFATENACYVIDQAPERLLEVALESGPDAAALTGWAVGNVHFPVEAQSSRLRAPDDTAVRQAFDRLGIAYRETVAVFRPHRLAASAAGHGHHHHDHHGAPADLQHPYIRPPAHGLAGRS